MAKKKSNPTAAAAVVGGDLEGRLESLRDLNQILLKEMVERREQVRDLQSCVDRLSEDRFLFIDIDRSFSDLVVTSRITEIAAERSEAEAALAAVQKMLEAVTSERDAARGDLHAVLSEKDSALVELDRVKREAEIRDVNARAEAERQRCDLEQTMMLIRDLEADKVTMEENARSMKKDLSITYDQLQMIQVEKGEIEKELQGLVSESATYKRDLNTVSKALEEAQEKIASCQVDNVGLREQILRMQLEFEADRADLIAEVDGLKGRLHNIELKKEETVEEKISLEAKVAHLQGIVSEQQAERDLTLQKLAEEEELKALVIEERLHLKEEKEKLQLELKSQKKMYELKLDDLQETVRKIEEAKDEIDGLRCKQASELVNLEMITSMLQAEKQSAINDLNLVVIEIHGLRLQVEELKNELHDEKGKIESLRVLNQLALKETVERRDQVKDLQSQLAELTAEKVKLESVVGKRDSVIRDLNIAVSEKDSALFELDNLKQRWREDAKRQKWELEQKMILIQAFEADKAAMEEKAMSLEKDLRSTYDQLQKIQAEKVEIEKDMKGIVSETAAYKRDLNTVSMALEEAQVKIASCQADNFSLAEQIAMLQLGFDADRIALIAEVDVLKERLHNIIGTKEEMEEAKVRLNAKFSDLQVEKDMILLKLAEEEKLKSLFVEEIERLKLEFGYLRKENEKLKLEINSQERLFEEEIDGLRKTIRNIKAAKDKIDGLWAMQELKVVDQQKQISILQAEKDSAICDLNLMINEVDGLRLQVEGLKKELCNSEAALDRLNAENTLMKGDVDSLVAEKSAVQEMARVTNENFAKVLCLLKATSEKIIEQEIMELEQDSGEDVLNAAIDDLKAIEVTFEKKAAKINEMEQELEVLQCARAESEKKAGVLCWVCPGIAAVLAAISYALGVSSR
ncbi:paramyosin-like [Zingiber officinale]|uniref:Uncharacterized protein n=1 Tax=Zingiber officinale TaxID=94328 RepID=A0A8J5FT82_ZINOF|nr:paramyosin-like [Zingiber officinale]KAG6491466.1 hypothetical protein ZIOFF_052817 [Zingiber officinale]